jgi:hypothetical protein
VILGPLPLAIRTSAVVAPPTVPVPTGLITLVWHDTPDYYTTATEERYWSDVHADCVVLPTAGYLGGGGWSGSSEDAYSITHPRQIPPATDTFGLGMRLRLTGYPSASVPILAVVDDLDERQVEVQLGTDGILRVYRDSTELAAADVPLPTYTEIKFGFRGRVSPTVGEVEVLVAYGASTAFTPIMRLTGANTAAAGTAVWTGIYLGRPPSVIASHAYAGYGTEALRPGYLVKALYPDTTAASAWVASSGTIPAALASPPDDDTAYIFASGVGQRYRMTMDEMPDERAIYGVRTVALVKNAAGQDVTHAAIISDGASFSVSPWRSVTDDAWTMVDRFDAKHPITGVTWTPASVNAASYGGEVAA